MKIYFNLLNQTKTTFSGNSQEFRKEYSQKIENGKLSETQLNNLKGLSERFTDVDLNYAQCIKAAKTNPFLLVHKPETIERNIRGAAKRFSIHGITTKDYLRSALHHPSLFSMSPQTVEKNIKKIVQVFAYDELTIQDLFRMAQLQPAIYTLNDRNLNRKINKVVQGIQCSRAEVVEVLKKHPTVCALNPKEIIKKFKFLKYIEQNKIFDAGKPMPSENELNSLTLKKSLTNSMELNYLILLRNKISSPLPKGSKLPFDYLEKAITEFLQLNNKKNIELKLPDNKLVKDFIKFVKNFSKSAIGKNIFRFKII